MLSFPFLCFTGSTNDTFGEISVEMQQQQQQQQQQQHPKKRVLFIYHPGCFVLDKTIEKLKGYLQSWGFHVDLMFENDGYEIDRSGGIPSYLRERVAQTDFFLLLYTTPYKGIIEIENSLLKIQQNIKFLTFFQFFHF